MRNRRNNLKVTTFGFLHALLLLKLILSNRFTFYKPIIPGLDKRIILRAATEGKRKENKENEKNFFIPAPPHTKKEDMLKRNNSKIQ